MKNRFVLFLMMLAIIFSFSAQRGISQSGFDLDSYLKFLQDNKNLESQVLLSRHAPQTPYYSGIQIGFEPGRVAYLDSVIQKYGLTEDELALLQKNQFLVTERLSFDKITPALDDIFTKELPVFVSTDAILHSLHISYGNLLRDMEIQVLQPELERAVDLLYSGIPSLVEKYGPDERFRASLEDADLYVTIAKSLMDKNLASPHFVSQASLEEAWEAIQSEAFVSIPLFTDIYRLVDFSQFTIRGHYARYEELHGYFKCMMWLGRMEFVLADAPREWYEAGFTREGLKRLNINALLINELIDISGTLGGLSEVDRIIAFMVGESDNLRPMDFAGLVDELGITGPEFLLDDTNFDAFVDALKSSDDFQQKILSGFVKGNPNTTEPTPLPVSYRLLGQRFIIDSYVFYKLVFDNVVYQERKVCRMMPDPLDVVFALGNDNALPLLQEELETWNYSSQLAGMRYLIDAYDQDFWKESLYNTWLQAIRLLNPADYKTELPLFMQTAAWQQQKINSQLASWTQLRHDNLLYAKQSYTHGSECLFPHSYVEPYPEFYRQIRAFAEKAETFDVFSRIRGYATYQSVAEYFEAVKSSMEILEQVAIKELAGWPLTIEEMTFLGDMLIVGNVSGPEFNGWYVDLFYDSDGGPRYVYDPKDSDFLVADVHTQPTDCAGNIVGRVLHVGVGQVNLGIFLAEAPSANYGMMAFTGPVMSYYESITDNFERLTDERWTKTVNGGELPPRPDWVNVYLADKSGKAYKPGRELEGIRYSGIDEPGELLNKGDLFRIYPNPFTSNTVIEFFVPFAAASDFSKTSGVNIDILNLNGQVIRVLVDERKAPGLYRTQLNAIDLPAGVYYARFKFGDHIYIQKLVKTK